MKKLSGLLVAAFICSLAAAGCTVQRKEKRSVTVEGPERKTELKIETTDKD